MDPEEDSIIIYVFRTLKYSERVEIGLKKGGSEYII